MTFVVVVYDIPSNRKRTKLRKKLKAFGEPVQLSVFECNLSSKEKKAMMGAIKGIISEKEDRVRIYEMCRGCRIKTLILGEGQVSSDPLAIVV